MKKFSTARFILAIAYGFLPLSGLATPLSPEASASMTQCEFLTNAPDQHVVVRSDTLWGISSMFLQYPWCWPQVWDINRDQIRDPHWIYPGQIVYLDRVAGRLRLGTPSGQGGSQGAGIPTVRLSPQMRIEGLGQDAIPAIPLSAIEPFLSQPLIVEEDELEHAARIVAAQEDRVVMGKGDKLYVRGDLKDGTSFQAFRPGRPLMDPVTNKVLGYEATFLGAVKLDRAAKTANEAHRFIVVSSKQEIGVGDQLVLASPTPILNYMPHSPAAPVDARIVAVYGGVSQAGQYQVVSVNRGKNHGLDVGAVLQLYRFGEIIADRTDNKKLVKLPDEQYGNLFIFRVFNNISYGLIMQVTDAVQIGDIAKSPE